MEVKKNKGKHHLQNVEQRRWPGFRACWAHFPELSDAKMFLDLQETEAMCTCRGNDGRCVQVDDLAAPSNILGTGGQASSNASVHLSFRNPHKLLAEACHQHPTRSPNRKASSGGDE